MRGQSSTIAQYENKIALLSQEIDRLNHIIQDKSSRYDEIYRERVNMENQLRVSSGEKVRFDEEIRRRNAEIDGMRLLIRNLEQ